MDPIKQWQPKHKGEHNNDYFNTTFHVISIRKINWLDNMFFIKDDYIYNRSFTPQ